MITGSTRRFEITLLAMIALWCVCQGFNTLLANRHSDALYYHLVSAWLWGHNGKVYFIEWLPWALQGGISEYIYAGWSGVFSNKLNFLIFAQFLHFSIGGLGSGYLVYRISCRYLPRYLALIAVLSFFCIPFQQATFVRAKNDGFLCLFELLTINSYLTWRDNKESRLRDILAIYFFGAIALAVKHTAVFCLIPLGALILYRLIREKKQVRPHIFAFFLFLPIAISTLLRNYIWTGNPFFPAFSEWFPASMQWLDPFNVAEINRYTFVGGSFLDVVYSQLSYYLWSKPIFLTVLLVPVLKIRKAYDLLFIYIAAILLFCALTGKGFSPRFGMFLYAVGSIVGLMVLHELLPKRPITLFLVGLLCVLIGGRYEVAPSVFARRTMPILLTGESLASYASKEIPYYPLHEWINQHVAENSFILSTYENESYFSNVPLVAPENHAGAAKVLAARTFDAAFTEFNRQGFTHLQVGSGNGLDRFTGLGASGFASHFSLISENNGFRLYKSN